MCTVGRGECVEVPIAHLCAGERFALAVGCESYDITVAVIVRSSIGPDQRQQHHPGGNSPPNRNGGDDDDGDFVGVNRLHDFVTRTAVVEEVIAPSPLNAQTSPWERVFEAPISGLYHLVLDNSFSWMRAKRVWFSGKVRLGLDAHC